MKIECKMLYPVHKYKPDGSFEMSDTWNPSWYMFASCCGATYTANPTEKTRTTWGKGIRVIAGHIGIACQKPKSVINHINTKNGPLTVVAKVK